MVEYTDIVSLGYRCRMARRLRDHFRFETAYPFDWWVTPAKSIVRMVEEWDVERLFDPSDIEELKRGDHVGDLRHRRYGIKFQHDVPRRDGAIVPDWRDHLAQAKARTAHLMRRFEQLNHPSRRVLFCREFTQSDTGGPAVYAAMRKVFGYLLPAAARDFVLVSDTGVEMPGWRTLRIVDPADPPWSGNPEVWDPALASLGCTLRPTEPPAEDRETSGFG